MHPDICMHESKHYFTPSKFFTTALVDGLSLESEWQQVSSSLQDYSLYTGRSQQCCTLDGFGSYSALQLFQLLYQPSRIIPSDWFTICTTLIFIFHSFLWKSLVLISLFFFLDFHSVARQDSKLHYSAGCLFCWLLLDLDRDQVICFFLKIPEISIHFIIMIILLESFFFTSAMTDGLSLKFQWQQISIIFGTLLSILADLNNAVVWIVFSRSVIFKSFSPCINFLVTVSRAPITIIIIVTFMMHNFFNSLARSK